MSLSLGCGWCSWTQGKSTPPRPLAPCSATRVHVVLDRQGGAQARPARRVDLLDENVDVACRLFGGDVAGGGRQADHLQFRIAQGQRSGEGAVDAGVRRSVITLRAISLLVHSPSKADPATSVRDGLGRLSRTSPSSTAAARPSGDRLRGPLHALGRASDPLGREQRGGGVGQHHAQRRPLLAPPARRGSRRRSPPAPRTGNSSSRHGARPKSAGVHSWRCHLAVAHFAHQRRAGQAHLVQAVAAADQKARRMPSRARAAAIRSSHSSRPTPSSW